MLHSVAQTVAAAVLLIGDLSVRWGQWRSDAAGTAQCGSGEAALCLLPFASPLSFFPIPISFVPYPTPTSFCILHCFCHFLPLILLFLSPFLSISTAPLLCYICWIFHTINRAELLAAFGCSDLVKTNVRSRCVLIKKRARSPLMQPPSLFM